MVNPVTITEFRAKAGPFFDMAIHDHQPLVIQRGATDRGLLLGEAEAIAVLGDRRFNPEVMRSQGSVSVWLPEFAVYGEGSSYAEAKEDLLSEVRLYVDEYLDDTRAYMAAPNRAAHLPYVLKAHLADVRGQLAETIFPAPPAAASTRTPLVLGTPAVP